MSEMKKMSVGGGEILSSLGRKASFSLAAFSCDGEEEEEEVRVKEAVTEKEEYVVPPSRLARLRALATWRWRQAMVRAPFFHDGGRGRRVWRQSGCEKRNSDAEERLARFHSRRPRVFSAVGLRVSE